MGSAANTHNRRHLFKLFLKGDTQLTADRRLTVDTLHMRHSHCLTSTVNTQANKRNLSMIVAKNIEIEFFPTCYINPD